MIHIDKDNSSNLLSATSKKLLTTTAITALGLSLFSNAVQAQNDWTDHTKVGGDATITIDATSVANTTVITQSGHRIKVEGDGDIKSGWTVDVQQDSSSSQYILFDVEDDPTRIPGNLKANGEIYIFDKEGVIFSNDSQVNVGSIVATSGDLDETASDFDTGRLVINSDSTTDGDVINRGTITVADGGLAALVAPNVTNSGVINAKMGKVILAARETTTLDMYGDGLVEIAVTKKLENGFIKNAGKIIANGGNVTISASVAKDAVDNVINMDGFIDVSSATVKGGKIVLSGGKSGKVNVRGTLQASGATGKKAGSVKVTGENVAVTNGAKVLANADADKKAGKIVLKADDTLTINGLVSAQGEDDSGVVETTAPNTVFQSNASILATREWEIKTDDKIINNALAMLMEDQLDNAGNMTLVTTNGDIDVNTLISWSSDKMLTLKSDNDLMFNNNGGVESNGAGNFMAQAGDDIRLNAGNRRIVMNGGNVDLIAADEFTINEGFVIAGGGNIMIDNGGKFVGPAESLRTSGTGTISLNQNIGAGATIQGAIDAIQNTGTGANTVNAGAGTWAESLVADVENLTLNGANAGLHGSDGARGAETVITPNSPGVLVTANNFTLDGVTIDGADDGVHIDNADNATITNNRILNSTDDGVDVFNSQNAEVSNNVISNTTDSGVTVRSGSESAVVNNNDIDVVKNGVRLSDADAASVTSNEIDDASNAGILATDSNLIEIIGNQINNNGASTYVDYGIRIDGGDGDIESNKIEETNIAGIVANNTEFLNIHDNLIKDGEDGILVDGGQRANIRDNTVQDMADDGIKVIEHSDVEVTGNTVVRSDDSGITVIRSDDAIIDDNNVDVARNGIRLTNSDNGQITNNEVDDTSNAGIFVKNGDAAEITNNQINDNGASTFTDYGILVEGTNATIISSNKIEEASEAGIAIKEATYADIDDNLIKDGGIGILAEGGELADIRRNEILRMGDNGIEVNDHYSVNLEENIIDSVDRNGIDITGSQFAQIVRNTINNTGDDAIDLDRSDDAFIQRNKIGLLGGANNIGDDGIDLDNSDDATIRGNNIQNVDENGIDNRNSNGTNMVNNTIRFVGDSGIYVKPSDDIRIVGNTVTDTGGDGIHVEDGYDVRVRSNTVRRAGNDGIDIRRNDFVRVTDNIVTDADHHGIVVRNARDGFIDYAAVIARNTVRRVGETGIMVERSSDVRIVDNIVTNAGAAGISIEDGDSALIRRNKVRETGRDGIHVGDVEISDIRNNIVKYTGRDGINIDDFGSSWIAYNDVSFTENDGIEASNGDFVSIYDNYVEFAGYINGAVHGSGGSNEVAESDDYGNDGIHVRNVGGRDGMVMPRRAVEGSEAGFGTSQYGMAVEIYGNDVAIIGDDGIQVLGETKETQKVALAVPSKSGSSAYIADNIVGHTGEDGVNVGGVDVTIVRDNAISSTEGHGIVIHDGRYAGVFDNRILLTGRDGIHVGDIYGGEGAEKFGDINYGYGWSVNVSGNEVALTGNDGIDVHDAGPTLVRKNKIFMAGMGEGLEDAIHDINGFASSTFSPVRPTISALALVSEGSDDLWDGGWNEGNSFGWDWGNGHGINVSNINDSYNSPNGWAADIRGNKVTYTGGHGISAQESDRTRINNNKVSYAGIDYTNFEGSNNILEALNKGPFDRENEGRRDLWQEAGSMIKTLKGYFGNTTEEPTDETPYLTISEVELRDYDGIHAENIYGRFSEGESGRNYSRDLKISGNDVRFSGDDGIEAVGVNNILVANNVVDESSDDGISILNGFSKVMQPKDNVFNVALVSEVRKRNKSTAVIRDNVVTNSGTPLPEINDFETALRELRSKRSGGDGIQVDGFERIKVRRNEVSDSVENGLYVSGPNNGKVEVSGNEFTDNDTGTLFESGEIDLTGDGNTYQGGRVGMRFAPAVIENNYYDIERTSFAALAISEPSFAPMSLVDDTIGAQTFNGQSGNFLELDNGAFFAPGTPTLLDATGSTFNNIGPQLFYTPEQIAFLESKIQHFNDNGSTGLFFFPELADINQEDIFEFFGPGAAQLGGLNVTILGLPTVPGGAPAAPTSAAALNNIAPAAGGGDPTSPEALNAIETAAGGDTPSQQASCFSGGALANAGSGQPVNISYGGSAADLLNSEESCGS